MAGKTIHYYYSSHIKPIARCSAIEVGAVLDIEGTLAVVAGASNAIQRHLQLTLADHVLSVSLQSR